MVLLIRSHTDASCHLNAVAAIMSISGCRRNGKICGDTPDHDCINSKTPQNRVQLCAKERRDPDLLDADVTGLRRSPRHKVSPGLTLLRYAELSNASEEQRFPRSVCVVRPKPKAHMDNVINVGTVPPLSDGGWHASTFRMVEIALAGQSAFSIDHIVDQIY
jgi:hypothetical protein